MSGILSINSVTKLDQGHAGQVVISGSHGGRYPGYLAAKAGVRAVILHDAGIGRDEAGIASLAFLQELGLAAATVDYRSARIGDAADMQANGQISHANATAAACGVEPGQNCQEAASLLTKAPLIQADPPAYAEGRSDLPHPSGATLVLIDSAAMVTPGDAGRVIITGSHGGLLGGDDWMALQTDGLLGAYNDAGIGKDQAGISRLPALQRRGIAGVTVAAMSARIGEARSTYADGVLSAANAVAVASGAAEGMRLKDFIDRLLHAGA
jgi:hypothetical protein